MTRVLFFAAVLALSACGVDGEPLPPKVSASQTIGVNSSTGPFSKTSIGFTFGG